MNSFRIHTKDMNSMTAVRSIVRVTSLLAAIVFASPSFADVVASWNFNSLTPDPPSNANVTTYASDTGSGSLVLAGISSNASAGILNLAGTTNNALPSTLAGQALAIEGSGTSGGSATNNGGTLTFSFNLSNYVDPVFSFSSRFSSSSGFDNNTVSYSTDGSSFTSFGSYTLTQSFAAKTFDLSSISAVDNSSSVYVRITLLNANAGGANNRLDNVQLNATFSAVPEPTAFVYGGLIAASLCAWKWRQNWLRDEVRA
jgi:hypothetical protein